VTETTVHQILGDDDEEDEYEEEEEEDLSMMHNKRRRRQPITTAAATAEDDNNTSSEICCFAKDGSCVRKTSSGFFSYRVPKKCEKYAGERCCGTCYYKCTAADERCAFANDGTCAVANRCEKDGMKVTYAYLKYRVPNSHARYSGLWCCNSCYYKTQAFGKMCAFAKDGTCLIANECQAKGKAIEYNNLPQRVPKGYQKFVGYKCCETCYNKCRATLETCAFAETGECEVDNASMKKNGTAPAYKRFHKVPQTHPVHAGKTCCNSCYIQIKARGLKCAFMNDGECSFAKNCVKRGIGCVYKNLTYKVPSSHEKYSGEKCCRTCYRKCAEHAKEVRWATVLSNLLEKTD